MCVFKTRYGGFFLKDKKKTMPRSIVKTDLPSMCIPGEGPEYYRRHDLKH